MKNGQLVRVLKDCTFTDKNSRTCYVPEQTDVTYELKKDSLLQAQVKVRKKDEVIKCLDLSFKIKNKVLPKGTYIELRSLPYDYDNYISIQGCLDSEIPKDIFLPIEERLITHNLETHEIDEGTSLLVHEIESLQDILNKYSKEYPLGITISKEISTSIGYYNSVDVETKVIFTGYRLETSEEVKNRKHKEELAKKQRVSALKKARNTLIENEKALYEKLNKKYGKETKKTNES